MKRLIFDRSGSHYFLEPVTGDVYIKNFEIKLIDKPQTSFELHTETQVRYKDNKAPTTVIPAGEYTLELLQKSITGIELSRGYGSERSIITLKVLNGFQIGFEPELIDLLGLDPILSTGWLGPATYKGIRALYHSPSNIIIKIPQISNQVFINGKERRSILLINTFDKDMLIGRIEYENQIDIEVVDEKNKSLSYRKFHLELALK